MVSGAGVGTVRGDRECPKPQGLFRKGFPTRREEVAPAARAERGWGREASPGLLPRCRAAAAGAGEGKGRSPRGAAPLSSSLPRRKFDQHLAARWSGAGTAPAGLLLRGWAWAGRRGERVLSLGVAAVEETEWGLGWRAACGRSPERRYERPGSRARVLLPWSDAARATSRLRSSSCCCCWEQCSAPEVSGYCNTLCPAAAWEARSSSQARWCRAFPGLGAPSFSTAQLPRLLGGKPCPASPQYKGPCPVLWLDAGPSPSACAGASGPSAGRGAGPWAALSWPGGGGEPSPPTQPLPQQRFGGGGRKLCSRGTIGGPGRGLRAGCLGGSRARRVGTAAAPEEECSRAPAAVGPLKLQPDSAVAPPGACCASSGTGSTLAALWRSAAGAEVVLKILSWGGVRCGFSEEGSHSMKLAKTLWLLYQLKSNCSFFVLCGSALFYKCAQWRRKHLNALWNWL